MYYNFFIMVHVSCLLDPTLLKLVFDVVRSFLRHGIEIDTEASAGDVSLTINIDDDDDKNG